MCGCQEEPPPPVQFSRLLCFIMWGLHYTCCSWLSPVQGLNCTHWGWHCTLLYTSNCQRLRASSFCSVNFAAALQMVRGDVELCMIKLYWHCHFIQAKRTPHWPNKCRATINAYISELRLFLSTKYILMPDTVSHNLRSCFHQCVWMTFGLVSTCLTCLCWCCTSTLDVAVNLKY